jgi:peptidyl-dipeptidase Dcp
MPMRRRRLLLPLALLAACATPSKPATTPFSSANPFAAASTLQYQAPPFDKIRNEDYQPAIEEGIRLELDETHRIAVDTAAATFDNTVIALERTGSLLTRVSKIFGAITQANTNDTLQQVQTDEAPKLAALSDAIHLNDTLFRRVKKVYDDRAQLDSSKRFLADRYYRDFVRAGALLADSDKVKLKALNQEESKLTTSFEQHLLAGTKAGALVIDDSAQLAGLSAGDIAKTIDAAKDRKLTGKWVLPLQNTTQQPLQASLSNRGTRQKLFIASTTRTEHSDTNDTRKTILRLAQLRAERAKILGFPDFAAYVLDDQMAKTPDAAIKLLTDLAGAAVAKAHGEAARMQTLIDAQKGNFKLQPWDWQFYAEQVRKADYAIDETQTAPYFELDRVLRDGVFFAATQLYGLTFKERKDLPVYHPDVRVFEVFDADGKSMALWYCDYFKRDNKSGGAWEDTFVDRVGLLGTLPVVYNVANFTKPATGQPALLRFDDVTTMFHEFGHALHSMLAAVQYPRLNGNVPTDFVEFPSQFNEHWALDPKVLANYAHHYQTGAAMPAELVAKIHKTSTFNQGFATTEYVAASLLDMAWHTLPVGPQQADVDSFETAALKRYHVDVAEVPPRYRSSYFLHIWANGYQANYYAYLWAEVLEDDAFGWFTEHGGLTRDNGQRFRDGILSQLGSADVATLFRTFRGRDPQVAALLKQRGLDSK